MPGRLTLSYTASFDCLAEPDDFGADNARLPQLKLFAKLLCAPGKRSFPA